MKKNIFRLAITLTILLLGSVSLVNAQWTTSGSNIRNSNTGYVGIGTSTITGTPAKKLHVHSTTSKDHVYISGTTPSIFLGESTSITASSNKMGTISMTTEANMFGFGTAAGDLIMSSKTGKLHFITGGSVNTSGTVRMTISSNGSNAPLVGIGTLNPTSTFQIVGMANNGADATLKIKSGSDSLIVDGKNINSFKDLTINGSTMKNISMCPFSGNVGIGKSNPNAKLDIVGNFKVGDNGLNSIILDGQKLESQSLLLINSVSKQNVGIGTTNPTSTLQIDGMGNDGTNATLKLVSGSQTMLLDGNEIDGLTALYLNSNSKKNVILCEKGGNVGIGTGTVIPTSSLQVEGIGNDGVNATLKLISGTQTLLLDGNEIDGLTSLHLNNNSQKNVLICEKGGNVGIGTDTPSSSYKLSVNGSVRAKEITVETNWSDFVFDKGYNLKSLQEVEKFISQNGHLPEIPNAKDVEKNGIKVGEVESKLLLKIEELTLYIIDLNKQIQMLKK